MKRLFTIAAAGLLCLSAVPEKPVHAQDTILTISGAGPQGRWFKEASLVGKFLTEQLESEGVQVNGVIGKGVSVGNIKRIAAGQIEGGRGFLPDLLDAYENKGQFEGSRDYSSVVAWITLNPLVYRLIAGQEIKSYEDLKGKTIAIGAKNSGDDARAIEILAAHGITEDNAAFQYLGRSDAQEALANRQIDALLIAYSRNNRGHLGPLFASRELGSDLRFVDMDPAMAEKIATANPAMHVDTLGEPVFDAPDLVSLGVHTGFMLSKSVDDDLVYKMTRLMFENWDTLTESAPWWKDEGVGPEKAAAFTATDYHAGAQRYYEEAGLWNIHRQ